MAGTRFHMSLNVSNLERSVAFYRILFGLDPAKLRVDYAKFEVDDPPLVFSLEPTPRGQGGALNHVGFRVADTATLVAMQERMAAAGLSSEREDGVECCYARQSKFWVHDPDRTLWEIYTFDGDIEHRGPGQRVEKVLPQEGSAEGASGATAGTSDTAGGTAEPVIWEHRMDQPLHADFADGSVDEVRLRGSFNLALPRAEQVRLLDEARRVLRPGGRIFVHVLTAAQSLAAAPDLPGPAAVVRHVPVVADLTGLLQAAGFEAVRLTKFDNKPCFTREGVGLRQTMLEAWKPARSADASYTVLYKGPFREVRDDQGRVFPRGHWVSADAATAARLRTPEWSETFLVLDERESAAAVTDCGTRPPASAAT